MINNKNTLFTKLYKHAKLLIKFKHYYNKDFYLI